MHCFCSLDGSAASDELSLRDYLNLDVSQSLENPCLDGVWDLTNPQDEPVGESGGTPSVIIRYRKTDAKVSAAASKFHGASAEVLAAMEQMKPDLTFQVSILYYKVVRSIEGQAKMLPIILGPISRGTACGQIRLQGHRGTRRLTLCRP